MKNNFFDTLKNKEYVFFKECYKTCNGYCCNNFHADSFKMIDSHNVILPMIEAEFLSMQKNGGMDNVKDFYHKTFWLKCGVGLKLYFLKCGVKGLCSPHCNRPLVCKIYPYFPLVDEKGEFLGVREVAMLDLFYKDDKNHPCTLVNTHKNELLKQFKSSTKELLKEPVMIFVFMALELLDKYLMKYFKNYFNEPFLDVLGENERKDFFKKYENNALLFKAWRNDDFKNEINELYLRLESLYQEKLSRYFIKANDEKIHP